MCQYDGSVKGAERHRTVVTGRRADSGDLESSPPPQAKGKNLGESIWATRFVDLCKRMFGIYVTDSFFPCHGTIAMT